MKGRTRWALALLAVLIVAGVGTRFALGPKAPGPAPAAQAPAAIDLAPGDVASVHRTELKATLAVSGGLRAVDSAIVKAKVAAELQRLTVREGDRVAAGQVIGQLDDTEFRWRLKQAEDQAAAALAQLQIAERTLDNNKALVAQGFISKTALDTSVSNAEGARASLQAAKAAAELARKSVADAVLRAPIAGLVSQRLVQPGERVPVDGKVVEIVDLSRLELEAAVAPEQVLALRVGQAASVTVDGLPEPLPAQVSRINPSTQAGTRAVMAYLALQPHPALRQGLFAQGRVELERRPALVVPASAVRVDQARPYVLLAAGGKAVARPVTLGTSGDAVFSGTPEAAVEVTQGVADGDIVLRGTVGSLREGTALKLAATP